MTPLFCGGTDAICDVNEKQLYTYAQNIKERNKNRWDIDGMDSIINESLESFSRLSGLNIYERSILHHQFLEECWRNYNCDV